MFETRELSPALETVRARHAPEALILESQADYETIPPAVAENLAPIVDAFAPISYPAAWVPASAPQQLRRLATDEFTIGAPGDGGVLWTHQTEPATVVVKPRLEGSPDGFVQFLIAEALVEAGTGRPEHFLGFFESGYVALTEAGLSPADSYQLAVALYDAHRGLATREVFREWGAEEPALAALHDSWLDAGSRLEPRLEGLSGEVARGETSFAAAAELGCAAIKHALDPPTPFGALDTAAYADSGAPFAVRWAEKTIGALR
jgi:hypothetical protein